jgi:16S rRNA (guanine966-N2)-methyltransferase
MKNVVKITSGKLRGRVISTPGGKTHPMGERERLALFNMISSDVPGAVVLDAYAGSGALGFEALSRGAKEVLFIDSNHKSESCIMDNMLSLGYYELLDKNLVDELIRNAEGKKPIHEETADVMRIKVSQLESKRKFDLILADPPYDKFILDDIQHLVQFLTNDGVFVLSHPGDAPELQGLSLRKSHKYAGATISVYVKSVG